MFRNRILRNAPVRKRKRLRRSISFDEFARIYMRRWSKVRKATWDDDRNSIRKYLLPAFGYTPIGSITRNDVWELLDVVASRHPGAANKLKSLLSVMFQLAVDWGYLPSKHVNPAIKIKKYSETPRDRYLSPDECASLRAVLQAEPCPYMRAFFQLLLLTGLRKGELLRLTWQDVDPHTRELRISKTKNRRLHYVPMSEPAVLIVSQIPRLPGNPYVFPGFDCRTNQPSVTPRPRATVDAAWHKIRAKAGIPDVWIHDLRRTAASYLAQEGVSLYLIGAVLNHSTPSTTARYARFQKGDIKEALNKLAQRLDVNVRNKSELGA